MTLLPRIALYARVSSERQAQAGTIDSQVAAIDERIRADGFDLTTVQRYLDPGHSGSSLRRPALDRLRDAAACGMIDRLYLLEPDRLARRFVHQWLLQEEFATAGITLIWVQHQPAATPEEELLVQIQGSVAQYERTKILERCRRGRRHAAQQGQVAALSSAPYGYRYVTKADGGGQARFEIDLAEARVVRQIFTWVADDRCSTVEVQRRLVAAGIMTRGGKAVWQRPSIHDLLTNPAYRGEAAFGRSRVVRSDRLEQARQPQRETQPATEWISIPVPPIISPALFAAAGEQLAGEQRRVQPRTEGYLLTGLLRCGVCQTACVGHRVQKRRAGEQRWYRYYRCQGTDRRRWGGERLCTSVGVAMDAVDRLVWQEVCRLLTAPEQVLTEYQRRLAGAEREGAQDELGGIERQLRQAQQARERLIDSYTEGLIEKADLAPRIGRFDERLERLRSQREEVRQVVEQEAELRLVIGRLEHFAIAVEQGLERASFALQRQVITTLVKRVELEPGIVRVVFRVDPGPAPPDHGLHFGRDRSYTNCMQEASGMGCSDLYCWVGTFTAPGA